MIVNVGALEKAKGNNEMGRNIRLVAGEDDLFMTKDTSIGAVSESFLSEGEYLDNTETISYRSQRSFNF